MEAVTAVAAAAVIMVAAIMAAVIAVAVTAMATLGDRKVRHGQRRGENNGGNSQYEF